MSAPLPFDLAASLGVRRWGSILMAIGGAGVIGALAMVFFYAPTELEQGPMQRMFYIHVPTAWLGELAFMIVALCSLGYLLLRDDRLDAIALSAAEVGFVFLTATLFAGPLWAKLAWGAWWVWDARLSFTLLLWFIWLGYFAVRSGTEDPDRGKRFGAVLAIIGAVDIPIIHMSVYWFRTQHPKPVILNPEGSTAEFEMNMTMLASVLALNTFFFGLLLTRYGYERLKHHVDFLKEAAARGEHA